MIAQAGPNWQYVIDGNGLSVTVTGMLIVFFALIIISVFIALLPRVLTVVARFFPEKEEGVARAAEPDARVIAALGYVLHQRMRARQKERTHTPTYPHTWGERRIRCNLLMKC